MRNRLGYQIVWFAILSVALSACSTAATTSTKTSAAPAQIADFDEEFARYLATPPQNSQHQPRKKALLDYLEQQTPEIVRSADYQAAVTHLGRLVDVLEPSDFEADDKLPDAFEEIAKFVAKEAAKRGDEARALAANRLLMMTTHDEKYKNEYQRIKAWGADSRRVIEDPVRGTNEQIDLWEEHARLSPVPDVLSNLVQLYLERRNMLLSDQFGARGLQEAEQIARIAPIEVAAVYLQYGKIQTALEAVKTIKNGGALYDELVHLLEVAQGKDADARAALLEFVDALRVAKPDTAFGMCRFGVQKFNDDFRFSLCLARIEADSDEYWKSIFWYKRAIEQAPNRVELYDELLIRLDRSIEQEITSPMPFRSHDLAGVAEDILWRRQARWPKKQPPLSPDRLDFLVGMLGMNAGKIDEAQKRLESSIRIKESPSAMLQLGRLLLRRGNYKDAETVFEKSIKTQDESSSEADTYRRAEIYRYLGEVAEALNAPGRAQRRYEQSLALFTELVGAASDPAAGSLVEANRGVLLTRLGNRGGAKVALGNAVGFASDYQETYAVILSCLVTAKPDAALAQKVLSKAFLRTSLDPEWKVYFGMWVWIISLREGAPLDSKFSDTLRRLGARDTWWGKLARFSVDGITEQELISQAANPGEAAEANFYVGARKLAQGDTIGAKLNFQAVIATNMINFYEFEMASRFLQSLNNKKL